MKKLMTMILLCIMPSVAAMASPGAATCANSCYAQCVGSSEGLEFSACVAFCVAACQRTCSKCHTPGSVQNTPRDANQERLYAAMTLLRRYDATFREVHRGELSAEEIEHAAKKYVATK